MNDFWNLPWNTPLQGSKGAEMELFRGGKLEDMSLSAQGTQPTWKTWAGLEGIAYHQLTQTKGGG